MIKFAIIEKEDEKKYKVINVAKALDVTYGALTAFMNKNYGGSREGMTISQIVEYICIPHKNRSKENPDFDEVVEIYNELQKRGIVAVQNEQLNFKGILQGGRK